MEQERFFLHYGMIRFLLHTLFLFLPVLPILVVAAAVPGVPFAVFAMAVFVLISFCLLCRLIGFLFYLLLGRWRLMGHFLSWFFYIVLVFATAFHAPRINPIRVIMMLGMEETPAGFSRMSMFSHYALAVGLAVCGFILINTVIIHFQSRRERPC